MCFDAGITLPLPIWFDAQPRLKTTPFLLQRQPCISMFGGNENPRLLMRVFPLLDVHSEFGVNIKLCTRLSCEGHSLFVPRRNGTISWSGAASGSMALGICEPGHRKPQQLASSTGEV